ncbi:MAG: tryptophan 2,3-dioxygenase family protein [Armatimonadota bacterium]|nr:tryptophan 2,3-dioxygenase family protein [Armatimonadota bacterium]MDR7549029.1 tryptophan 2,3-dioxygenase family protein [Armatimonadota bacterium]
MHPTPPEGVGQTVSGHELTYARYLHLDDLMELQRGRTGSHDELQFIVVHQVFELWFKLLLHELRAIRSAMQLGDLRGANRLLRRTHEILRILIAAFPLLETMRPADFLEIRSELREASGFQSRRFREIEFISGLRDQRYLQVFEDDPEDQAVLRAALQEPTLWDAFVGLVKRKGYPAQSDEEIIRALIAIHVSDRHPAMDTLVDGLLEYDLLFAQWRTRHVLMVERMIGAKPGTGQKQVAQVAGAGYALASGVDYLKTTLHKRFFPLLWQARTFLGRGGPA